MKSTARSGRKIARTLLFSDCAEAHVVWKFFMKGRASVVVVAERTLGWKNNNCARPVARAASPLACDSSSNHARSPLICYSRFHDFGFASTLYD